MGIFNQPAVKERLKARVAIDGPTGAGKTWTALQWAVVLAGGKPMSAGGEPIGLIDTENRSAAYYAPTPGVEPKRMQPWDSPYEFLHLPMRPPYSPIDLAKMIEAAYDDLGDDGVLIIDSLTHYWNGEGGTLDIVDNAASRGNSFTGWKEGTPAQRHMLDTIIHAPFHVIVTMRSKMEYVLVEEVKNGRTISVPTKVGMAPEQRAGVEYEFTVVADMDLEHRLVVSKSRCDLIADVVAPKGRSAEVAVSFRDWLGTGVLRVTTDEAAELVGLIRTVQAHTDLYDQVKAEFKARFGAPHELTVDRLEEARAWIIERTAPPAPPADGETQPTDSPLAEGLTDEPPEPAADTSADAAAALGDAPLHGALADALADVGAAADAALEGAPT